MGLDIAAISTYAPRLATQLQKLDAEGDHDGQIEIPDIKGTPAQEVRLQDTYRQISTTLQGELPAIGAIRGADVLEQIALQLVEELGKPKDEVYRMLLENYEGKRVASGGDSMLYNMSSMTGFENGMLPHTLRSDFPHSTAPEENAGYCESLRGCLQIELGFDPSEANLRTIGTAFPANLPDYIRGKKRALLYPGEFMANGLSPFNRRLSTGENHPEALWFDLSIPAATLTDFMTPANSGANTMGGFFLDRLVPSGELALDLLIDHLVEPDEDEWGEDSGAYRGGALILHFGQDDLFTQDGFIMGRPRKGNITPAEFRANVEAIAQRVSNLPHRVIWIKPLRVDQLVSPIDVPHAHFTNGEPIPPGEYYAIRPWVDAAKQGAPLERTNVLNRAQVEALIELQAAYGQAIEDAAAATNQIIPIDVNPYLLAAGKQLAEGTPIQIGDCLFYDKDELLTFDGIHPRPALYALVAKWAGEELGKAGVAVQALDLDQMARQAAECYCSEPLDHATLTRLVNFGSATLATMKHGNPGLLRNLFSVGFDLYGYGAVQPSDRTPLTPQLGVGGMGYLQSVRLAASQNLQMTTTLFRLGMEGAYDVSSLAQEAFHWQTMVGGPVSQVSLFRSPGTYGSSLSVGWAFQGLENVFRGEVSLEETLAVDLTYRYGIHHASNAGELGFNVFLKSNYMPFAEGKRFFGGIQMGMGYHF